MNANPHGAEAENGASASGSRNSANVPTSVPVPVAPLAAPPVMTLPNGLQLPPVNSSITLNRTLNQLIAK